jgi:HemY protein
MRRVVVFLVVACVCVGLAWVIFHLPGTVSAQIGPYSVAASSPVAALALIVLFLVVYAVLKLAGLVVFMPRRLRRWRANRNRRFGDIAVTRTLVALAAGAAGDARREAGRARRLLGETPQTLLLTAEAGRSAGREDEAADAFRKLSLQPDAAFLGLRGLLRQAMERENWAEASALAQQAEASQPAAIWLRQERAALAIRTENWVEALHLADADAPKAALAAAAAGQATNPVQALRLARQAWKEDRTLPAAALAYAAALRADGRESRAQTILRESWEAAPHPDIAACFMATLRDGPSRYAAAKRLTKNTPRDVEARLVLARTALEAGQLDDARFHAEAARATDLNQRRLWLLMADIAEAEGGETEMGRLAQRDALRRSTNADPDPTWVCSACGLPSAAWHPICPACRKAGTLRWGASPVSVSPARTPQTVAPTGILVHGQR